MVRQKHSKSSTGSNEDNFQALEAFFTGPLASQAASGMSNGIQIALIIEGKPYIFSKNAGKNTFCKGECKNPELSFWLTNGAMQKLITVSNSSDADIARIGIAIFDGILSKESENKIRFAIQASFLKLWSKGYFSVLKTGGPDIAAYLARIGFGSIQHLKKLFRKE